MTRVFEPPVYCYHEIVHNQFVVDYFKSVGVIFIDDVADRAARRARDVERPRLAAPGRRSGPRAGGTVIDAVCPLVTKVHHELKVRANKGYTVLYVGHEDHEEAVGTMAVAPEAVHLIKSTRGHRRRARPRRAGRAAQPDDAQPRRVAGPARVRQKKFPRHLDAQPQ